jgi:DNA-binding NarL/FixJ family response regulator
VIRIALVGPPAERARFREDLRHAPVEIVGEFQTLAAARRVATDAEATLVATSVESRSRLREPLTSREVQVLELLAEGLSNKAIGARLDISDQTVKFHVASIAGKLGARNRTDAVRRALRLGLIAL